MIAAAALVMFGLDQVEEPDVVVRPDALAEIVEQFDHGEGLLRRPVGRDVDGMAKRPLSAAGGGSVGAVMAWRCGAGGRAARSVRGLP